MTTLIRYLVSLALCAAAAALATPVLLRVHSDALNRLLEALR